MAYAVRVTKQDLTEEESEYFTKINPGMTPTGDLLTQTFLDGTEYGLVVFKAKFTPYGGCRDCGDHYIIACYDRYDRIDKDTLEITRDVEDI